MPQIAVRPLSSEDAPALYAACWSSLAQAQAHERVAHALALARRGRAWPVVGLYEGHAVGYGLLGHWRDRVEIADLVVGEAWRSRGLGSAIVSRLVETARQKGFARVEVGVAESNSRARALYQRLGFNRLEGRLVLDLGDGPEPVVYLSLGLDGEDR